MEPEETEVVQEPAAEVDPLDKVYEGMQDKPAADEPAKEPAKPAATPDEKGGNDKPAGTDGLDEKTLSDIREGKLIPKHRFDELSERIKAFESFGTPEQLRGALSKLAEIDKMQGEEKKDAIADLTDEEKELRTGLHKIAPELEQINKMREELDRLKADQAARTKWESDQIEASRNERNERATNKVKELCEKNGLDCSDKIILNSYANGVAGILNANEELVERFEKGDFEAVQIAFDSYFKKVFSGFQRKAKADLLNDKDNRDRLPKAPARGGTPPSEGKKKQTPAEAMDAMADAFVSAAKE